MLILSGKKLILLEDVTPASISDEKILVLTGKIEKAYLAVPFFVYLNDEIPTIFSNKDPGAQSKLAYAYYVFPL